MSFELDHLFICTSVGAPEADRLIEFGLTEGSPNVHPGQGTANRRFFFHNAMLELLWVSDPTEAQSETTRPTRLWKRWMRRDNGACPFGFCFRPKTSHAGTLPFPAWEYRPGYLPPSLCIHVATNSQKFSEPMLFYLAFVEGANRRSAFEREPTEHATGLKEVTRLEFVSPHSPQVSPELKTVSRIDLVKHREGQEYLVELGFDGETRGKKMDFRPALPLVFFW